MATPPTQQSSAATETRAAAYQPYARKYRPMRWDDLVGQETTVRILRASIEKERVGTAYLFTGSRGIGKTSLARIFAKALTCQSPRGGVKGDPCAECGTCLSIARGDDTDILEIDGASNTGVDNVRQIRDEVRFTPARAPYKIYIIDEVHMLTTAAFNALLKTLEEPPPHVKFFFATTEPDRIPETVLSRCLRFDFKRVPVPRIAQRLREICATEGAQAEEAALERVARMADGGMRDALKLLDQLVSTLGGTTLTVAAIDEVFGLAGQDTVDATVQGLLDGNTSELLKIVAGLHVAGRDLGEFVNRTVARLRDLLLALGGGEPSLPVPPGWREASSLEQVLAAIEIFVSSSKRFGDDTFGRVWLEATLVRAARLRGTVAPDELLQRIIEVRDALASGQTMPVRPAGQAGSPRPSGPRTPGPTATRPDTRPEPEQDEPDEPLERGASGRRPAVVDAGLVNRVDAPEPSAPAASGASRFRHPSDPVTLKYLTDRWRPLVEKLGETHMGALVMALTDSSPVSLQGDQLTVVARIAPTARVLADALQDATAPARIGTALSVILDHRLDVTFRIEEPAAAPPAAKPTRPAVEGHDAVKLAIELFDGRLIDE